MAEVVADIDFESDEVEAGRDEIDLSAGDLPGEALCGRLLVDAAGEEAAINGDDFAGDEGGRI